MIYRTIFTGMTAGRPGGQGKFDEFFSEELTEKYKEDLKAKWVCDTMFVYINKKITNELSCHWCMWFYWFQTNRETYIIWSFRLFQ